MTLSVPSELYNSLLQSIATELLTEAGHSTHHLHDASVSDIRAIAHHLLVVRAPSKRSSGPDDRDQKLFSLMDTLLDLEFKSRSMVSAQELPPVLLPSSVGDARGFEQIALWKGDITTLEATAIVNAANSALLGCFQPSHKCIDNVIHSMAGPRLRAACHAIVSSQAHEEPVGHAQITSGFALPASYVLHTVGPQLRRGSKPTAAERDQLQSCYTSSLDLLLKTVGDGQTDGPVTVAFPCISTGLFAFPGDIAVQLAVDSVLEWLATHQDETRGWKVIFNTFLKSDYDLYRNYIECKCSGSVSLPLVPDSPVLRRALEAIRDADYLLVSAGAGLSAAAGLDFGSEDVMKMLHPNVHQVIPSFRTLANMICFRRWDDALKWGFFFKNASIIRYDWARYRLAPTYAYLKSIADRFECREKGSVFTKTSNGDGIFEQEGFDPSALFVMQGDFGLIQCAQPCTPESVWDIKPFMEKGMQSFNAETYRIDDPAGIPKCPKCGGRMSTFLREDNTFLESGIKDGRDRYEKWLTRVMDQVQNKSKKMVILEVGAGFNTPTVLRLPDERLAFHDGVQLVRVNPEYPEMPFRCHGVGVTDDATSALDYISHHLQFQ
uniref:Macro domain-containing protein n=2 Tax=Hyaloperonospora arabidopsidis (strain Emoy2) TaxID=559515 RepID=M4C5V0_HYAAE